MQTKRRPEVVREAIRDAAATACAAGCGTVGARVDVPADVWTRMHSILATEPVGCREVDTYHVTVEQADAVLIATAVYYGRGGIHLGATAAKDPSAANRTMYAQFRQIAAKIQPLDERLESDGQPTDEPDVIDDLYARSRERWFRDADTSYPNQMDALNLYAKHINDLPPAHFKVPTVKEIYDIVLNTPVSGPGIGGVPFTAWRLVPLAIAMLIRGFLIMLTRRPLVAVAGAPDRVQLVRWMLKKKHSAVPEGRRPLGLPRACYRFLNAVLLHALRPVQPLLSGAQLLTTNSRRR